MSVVSTAKPLSQTPVVILAGGKGERLLPLTLSRPKPLLPLGSVRIIDFTLLNCRDSGLTSGVLLTQYRHNQLAEYIEQNWSARFSCVPPAIGMRYRGTADAVFQNLPLLFREHARHVLVLSGDHVYRMDYRKLLREHIEKNADVTISTVQHSLAHARSFGVVEVDRRSRVTGFVEKPSAPRSLPDRPGAALVSMGIYVFRLSTLKDALETNCGPGCGSDFGHHVIPALMGSARIHAYNFRDEARDVPCYWRDIGTVDSYHETAMDLLRRNPPLDLRACRCSRPPGTVPPTSNLSPKARISRTLACSGVQVEQDAEVEDSILMPGVHVARGARLRHAIIEEGVQIPAGFTVGWDLKADREQHAVSLGGVVVVTASQSPKPLLLSGLHEKTVAPRQRSSSAGSLLGFRTGPKEGLE